MNNICRASRAPRGFTVLVAADAQALSWPQDVTHAPFWLPWEVEQALFVSHPVA